MKQIGIYAIAFWERNKTILIILFKLIVFTLLALNIYLKITAKDFSESWNEFTKDLSIQRLWYIAPILILMFYNWYLEAKKWFIAANYIEETSFSDAHKAVYVGNAFNMIVPANMGEMAGRALFHSDGHQIKAAAMTYYVGMSQKVGKISLCLVTAAISFYLGWIKNPWMYGLFIFSLFDVSFWALLFFYPARIIPFIKKYNWTRPFTKYLDEIEDFKQADKYQLVWLSFIRTIVFIVQHFCAMLIFFGDVSKIQCFILTGVNFLVQTVLPSLGFIDIGIRGNQAILAFEPYHYNIIGLLAASYLIWFINFMFPSLIGYVLFLFIKKK